MFNKNIDCDCVGDYIAFFANKKKYLHINKNIIVRDGSICVLTHRGRVCDVLLPGKYKINSTNLPIIFDKSRVEKNNKKGKKIRKIRSGIFFVNSREMRQFAFSSDVPFKAKSQELGRIKGCLNGECITRVIDAELLIKNLLSTTKKIKNKNVNNIVGIWIGNKINKKIEKEKVPTSAIITGQEGVEQLVNVGIEDAYDKYGIFVKNIRLKSMKFKKKYQKKVNEYLVNHKQLFKPINLQGVYSTNQTVLASSRGDMMNSSNVVNSAYGRSTIMTRCPNCNHANRVGANICNNCGHKI